MLTKDPRTCKWFWVELFRMDGINLSELIVDQLPKKLALIDDKENHRSSTYQPTVKWLNGLYKRFTSHYSLACQINFFALITAAKLRLARSACMRTVGGAWGGARGGRWSAWLKRPIRMRGGAFSPPSVVFSRPDRSVSFRSSDR